MTGSLAARKRMRLASENFDLFQPTPLDQDIIDSMLFDDDAIACHEAGHAVAAVVLGIGIREVSTTPDAVGGTDGRVAYKTTFRQSLHPKGEEQGGIDFALSNCISIMAGPAAELRGHGEMDILLSSAREDCQLLFELSALIGQEMFRQGWKLEGRDILLDIQQWAWREACLMMANPRIWRAVWSLMMHLHQNETATESDVTEIVAMKSIRYRPRRFRLPPSGDF